MEDIFLGRIVKAFGIRGELKFHPSDDFWENVLQSKHLVLHARAKGELNKRSVVFRKTRPHGNSYVIEMEGVTDRDAAEALVGSEIFIERDRIDVELPDQYLPYQLLGMVAKAEDGQVLGRLTSIMYSSAHDIYEITGETGKFLVPAVPEFIVSIDDAAHTLIVRPLPGLIDQ